VLGRRLMASRLLGDLQFAIDVAEVRLERVHRHVEPGAISRLDKRVDSSRGTVSSRSAS